MRLCTCPLSIKMIQLLKFNSPRWNDIISTRGLIHPSQTLMNIRNEKQHRHQSISVALYWQGHLPSTPSSLCYESFILNSYKRILSFLWAACWTQCLPYFSSKRAPGTPENGHSALSVHSATHKERSSFDEHKTDFNGNSLHSSTNAAILVLSYPPCWLRQLQQMTFTNPFWGFETASILKRFVESCVLALSPFNCFGGVWRAISAPHGHRQACFICTNLIHRWTSSKRSFAPIMICFGGNLWRKSLSFIVFFEFLAYI